MVMGSKRIKGVVAVASRDVQVAEDKKLRELRKKLIKEYCHGGNPSYEFFNTLGTPGALESSFLEGDSPVKNWRGWKKDFRGYRKIGGERFLDLKSKPYGCWLCPISCGGYVKVPSGPYAGEGHKPEYETLGAFGTMCLNDDVESICRLNTICNDAGMDTISTGATIAFAIECYEKGIISKDDTDGIELTWGNHAAIVKVRNKWRKGRVLAGKCLEAESKTRQKYWVKLQKTLSWTVGERNCRCTTRDAIPVLRRAILPMLRLPGTPSMALGLSKPVSSLLN
jgi:aldehyde:ferredoxin oxidoreductase